MSTNENSPSFCTCLLPTTSRRDVVMLSCNDVRHVLVSYHYSIERDNIGVEAHFEHHVSDWPANIGGSLTLQ